MIEIHTENGYVSEGGHIIAKGNQYPDRYSGNKGEKNKPVLLIFFVKAGILDF